MQLSRQVSSYICSSRVVCAGNILCIDVSVFKL
jgi:hypothetical protein